MFPVIWIAKKPNEMYVGRKLSIDQSINALFKNVSSGSYVSSIKMSLAKNNREKECWVLKNN